MLVATIAPLRHRGTMPQKFKNDLSAMKSYSSKHLRLLTHIYYLSFSLWYIIFLILKQTDILILPIAKNLFLIG